MINYDRYKHISFDLWLTLIKSDPGFKQQRNSLLKKHFGINSSVIEIGDCVKKYDVLFNTINEKTGRNIESAEMWWVILQALGVEIKNIESSSLDDFEAKAEELFFLYPPQLMDEKTSALLSMLSEKNITLSLLSNTAFIKGNLLRRLLDQYQLSPFFAFQLYSDEVGYSKPHPHFFQLMYTEAARLRPITTSEILHIGDNPVADVKGATDAGMAAVLFNAATNTLTDCFAL